MNKPHYFFAIRYLPDDVDCGLLAGRCISTLHGFNRNHPGIQIGVAFPEWSDKSLGCSIAFVSTNQSLLEQFRERSYFQVMQADHLFALSLVLPVPDTCQKVRFIRNQNLAKLFVGERQRRLARAKRRAEARGEVFQPHTTSEAKEIGVFHSVVMQSASSNQSYILHVQKYRDEQNIECGSYSSYGLASNERYTGHVPDLGTIVSTLFK
ncbi:type I-F CRISPR-associated endoribonuclease Cas6/Csy4 [Aeromonas salmonicida]|uniref:type I-F CRISPR-associated endoribonuclease Cas6/Csy4 n=1 Tax=Aeromonas salmonicida TaxID=645 RepID=UPI000F787C2E|nr:type I-F CRISPR-associated endoribonuclease Cas6/Csy4 [Aeromonas salmonicida]RSM21824.1 type I-F CRISPR-associated endoribonuclease Cas6/Csy4 [Aeromonas salmonicida]